MSTVTKIKPLTDELVIRPWEDWEIGFLSACWADLTPVPTIAADLGRSIKSVRVKAGKLRLFRPRAPDGRGRRSARLGVQPVARRTPPLEASPLPPPPTEVESSHPPLPAATTPDHTADLAHLHAQLASASRLLADQDQTLAGLRAELARLTTLRSAPAPAVLPSPVPRPPEPTADLERQRVALRQLCILVAIQARQVEPLVGCRAMGLSPAAADRFRETAVATGVRAAQTMPPKGAP